MNQRIKELADKCRTLYRDGNGQYVEQFDEEKFAELIIKECLEQVRDEVQYEYDWKLADAVTERVMEHFGVEE